MIVNRGDCDKFRPCRESCPVFAEEFNKAISAGVRIVVAKIVWDADGNCHYGGLLPISKKNDEISTNAKEDMPKITQAPKDWKLEEKCKKEDAKKKAAEVMKKLRETGLSNKKTAGKSSADAFMEKVREIAPSKKKRSGKSNQKKHQLKRQVLNTHNLSESESD